MLKEIKRLKSVRGQGTELISVYIPAGFALAEEISKLKQEHSQSGNIKSNTTRANVQSAIDKMVQYLRLFKEPPKNGFAIFCGNLSESAGKTDIELFSMEPPEPLKVNIYRCDSTFLLEPIEEMLSSKELYILLAMDGREATIATLNGHQIRVIKRLHSMAHAKIKKGGQSAGRFSRQREEDIGSYYTEISETISGIFLQEGQKVKGLIIGGPGPMKEIFAKAGKINYQVKTLGVFDTGYTDETGLHELVKEASDLLKEQAAAQERRILERFITSVSSNGPVVYGYEATEEALLKNQVSTLIINEDVEIYKVKYRCSLCNETIDRLEVDRQRLDKHTDGGTLSVVEEKDAVEELIGLADKNGADTIFVSSESSYGKEFLMGFKGVGALLRYK